MKTPEDDIHTEHPEHQVHLGLLRVSYLYSGNSRTPIGEVSNNFFSNFMKTPGDDIYTEHPEHLGFIAGVLFVLSDFEKPRGARMNQIFFEYYGNSRR